MLSGCMTVGSYTEGDYLKAANDRFREAEASKDTGVVDQVFADRLARLWADNPEITRWLSEDHKLVRAPRLIGQTTPKYPLVPWLTRTRANVVLSVVIGRDGNVANARVYESSNSWFDAPALEAVREWKFLSAESASGPEVSMVLLPVRFEARPTGTPAL